MIKILLIVFIVFGLYFLYKSYKRSYNFIFPKEFKKLNIQQAEALNKYPKEKQTFACPKCERATRKQPEWDIWHCISCQYSIDLWNCWNNPPKIIDVETEPYDAYEELKIVSILKH